MTAFDIIKTDMLRFERRFDAPIERVWQFLVDPDLRARWFMGGSTDTAAGGRIGFTMNHDRLSDGDVPTPERYRSYLGHSWEERITRIEPPRLLAFTWENGDAGDVCFELIEEAGGTRLVLTHTGLRRRDDALNFGGGWHSHLAVLEHRIADEAVPDFWELHSSAEKTVERTLDASA